MTAAKLIATSFGAGYLPKAPGTFGALVGVMISLFLFWTNIDYLPFQYIHILLIVISYLLGVWACQQLDVEWGHDPSKVVIDETMGYWISIVFLPINLYVLILGFILFRFFDILKPLGIRSIDKMKSHHSVMLDDVVAGIYANICIQIFFIFYP